VPCVMALPVVVIVGRTNVGKSALFNRLAAARVAVVEDTPGITRDRIYREIELDGRHLMLVDTGGLVGAESDELIVQVKEQAARALGEADLLLMVVDGQEGVTSLDHDVAEVVRRTGKPYVLIANKMESPKADSSDFYDLRLGAPVDISALHGTGIGDVMDEILDKLPEPVEDVEEPVIEGETAIAVIGRPNVGKSALINALLGEARVIVSDVPGTTRDAIDIRVTIDGDHYRLVDTAGLRRAGQRTEQRTEYYSSLRTFKAVERADLALIVVDAAEGVTDQDAHIAGEAHEAGRGLAIVANKWDRVRELAFGDDEVSRGERQKTEELLRSDFEQFVRHKMAFAGYASVLYTSALTGEGVAELLPHARRIAENYRLRVGTGPLNRLIRRAITDHQPPSRHGKQLRIYYASQVRAEPPTFVLFVNDTKLMHFSYERYLINKLRAEFGFEGTPIRVILRKREQEGATPR
jgi:GTPase